jgi:uncharacterized phage protein (TIGR01671 family)
MGDKTMREIKFRAILTKKFNAKKPGKFVYFTIEELDHFYEVRLPIDWNTVQQFTGLKDKNGVEIFEGDILVDDTDGLDYGVVEWFEGGWTVEPWYDTTEFFEMADCHQIIGNVFENKELLKEPTV